MKYAICLLLAALALASCFSTKLNNEESEKQRLQAEKLHKDSLWAREHTPDTALVAFKRTMFCDGKQQVTFDRVDILTGSEAAEYSERHSRFDSPSAVVVNSDPRLETLPLSDSALVQLFRADSLGAGGLALCQPCDVDDIPVETVLQIVIYGKSIVSLKEMRYGGN